MDDVAIRPARPGDGAGIARIHVEAAEYYARVAPDDFQVPDQDGIAEALDPRPRTPASRLQLVAEVDGEIVGAVAAELLPPLSNARYQIQPALGRTRLSIGYLVTGEAHRQRGIATRLVEAAEAWGREHGAVVAVTDTYLDSPLSIPFWERRMGYRRRSVNLVKPLED